jgi:DNA-binding SARP family transcriptional activator/tetratricopeptide (TPR) repeat protein
MLGRPVQIEVLGPLRVVRERREIRLGRPGERAVLGLMVLAGGEGLRRTELIDALWPDGPPASAVNVIQTHVKHLRQLLEPERAARTPGGVLVTVGDGYALRLPAGQVDLLAFRQGVTAAEQARRDGDLDRQVRLLEQALALWRGRPLADLPLLAGHPWVAALGEERRAAVAAYGTAMIAAGRAGGALAALEQAAADQPLDETAQALLIRACHAAGQRGRGFAVYQRARQQLADELGVDPGAELRGAHALLLAEAPAPPGASRRALPPPAQLPADIHGFTGRAAEQARLDRLLAGHAGCTAVLISAVAGTAGVGKTALAVHWAHQVRDAFPDGQLYLNLRGYDPERRLTPEEALTRLLGALGVGGADLPADLDGRAALYRSALDGRRVLILLDNAATVDQVRPLLPGSATCLVVVTSRDSLAGLVALHGAYRLDLEVPPPDDALALLRALLRERVDAEPRAAAELVRHCAGLPLALRVAAELAADRPAATLGELATELADQQRRLDLLDAGGDPRGAVRAVFSWSYQHLPPEQARLFRLLALHPGLGFEPAAFVALAGVGTGAAARLLAELARAHLVRAAGPGRHTMHDLLRAYAGDLCRGTDPDGERRAAVTRLLEHHLDHAGQAVRAAAGGTASGRCERARAWLRAELPNLLADARHAVAHGWPRHAIQLAAVLGPYLSVRNYHDAHTFHTCALRAAALTRDVSARAYTLLDLGMIQWRLGLAPAAASNLAQAAALLRRLRDRPGEALALLRLGGVLFRLDRYAEAAEHQERALAVFREVGDRHGESQALVGLGFVQERLGRYANAIELYLAALGYVRTAGLIEDEATTLVRLGSACTALRRWQPAAYHLRAALSLFRASGSKEGEAWALVRLADVDARQQHARLALTRYDLAIAIFGELGHRIGEADALNGIGEAVLAQQPARALAQHEAALELAGQIASGEEQARAHEGQARAHHLLGDLAGARRHWHSALGLYTRLGLPGAERAARELAELETGALSR